MIRTLRAGAAGAALLFSAPVVAQDADADSEALAALQETFKAEPLTAEQQARLPLARALVDKIMPPGSLGEMMSSMLEPLTGPITMLAAGPPLGDVTKQLAIDPEELYAFEDEQLAEMSDILDPVWNERGERIAKAFPAIMDRMMTAIEPGMRRAMAEAHAIYFTDKELADIDAFFSTESGISYARKSYTMFSDPRILTATMQSLPELMDTGDTIEREMKEVVADLPAPRTFAELSAEERARLAELLGWSVEELEANMHRSSEQEANIDREE